MTQQLNILYYVIYKQAFIIIQDCISIMAKELNILYYVIYK